SATTELAIAELATLPGAAHLVVARAGRIEVWVDEALVAAPHFANARVEHDVALVHVVGPTTATRVLETLAAAGIEPLRMLAGEHGTGLGVRGADYATVVRALHTALLVEVV